MKNGFGRLSILENLNQIKDLQMQVSCSWKILTLFLQKQKQDILDIDLKDKERFHRLLYRKR